MSLATLDRAIDATLVAQWIFRENKHGPHIIGVRRMGRRRVIARERRRRSALLVKLAAELVRRENAGAPATAGELLERYLEQLPAGIVRDEVIPAAIE